MVSDFEVELRRYVRVASSPVTEVSAEDWQWLGTVPFGKQAAYAPSEAAQAIADWMAAYNS